MMTTGKSTSVYFDPKRALEEKNLEEQEEIKEKKEKKINEERGRQVLKFTYKLFLSPIILMWLWNWLIPGLFGLAAINYLQAFVLCWISRILRS
tara:strand:- start:1429 stop:1710 length:282 start_codon:yes stop_codon:yes gene_type:complete